MVAIEVKAMLFTALFALMLGSSAAQPGLPKQKTDVEVVEPMWTVVHPKHKGRMPMVLAHLRQEPEKEEEEPEATESEEDQVPKEGQRKRKGRKGPLGDIIGEVVKTLKKKIWDMGKEMCKGRKSEHCKRFGMHYDDEEEEESEEDAQKAVPAPAPAPEELEALAAPAPEPEEEEDSEEALAAPAPAPAEEKPDGLAEPAPAPAEEDKEEEEEGSAPAPAPVKALEEGAEKEIQPPEEVKEGEKDEEEDAEKVAEKVEKEEEEEKQEEEPTETTPKPPKLQSQGFRGKKVRHVDGETVTGDWRTEYGHARKHGHRHEHSDAHSARVFKSSTTLWTSLLVMCGILFNS
mmetsp:Transcript_32656/g.59627  ORF Transcript_32656/g.59627 Transcript_32656/m.59627 type:complete len:347 (-) Transcript_32656:76-1116(-)